MTCYFNKSLSLKFSSICSIVFIFELASLKNGKIKFSLIKTTKTSSTVTYTKHKRSDTKGRGWSNPPPHPPSPPTHTPLNANLHGTDIESSWFGTVQLQPCKFFVNSNYQESLQILLWLSTDAMLIFFTHTHFSLQVNLTTKIYL